MPRASSSTSCGGSRRGAVVLTPAHQYPTGAVLSAAPPPALAAWAPTLTANRRGRLRRRVPLRPSARGCAPGCRAGPGHLRRHALEEPGARPAAGLARPACAVARPDRGRAPGHRPRDLVARPGGLARCSSPTATSTATCVARGACTGSRRDALIAALARWLPDARPSGVAAGLHVLVTLPDLHDEPEIVARARAAGVGVYPLSPFRTSGRPTNRPPWCSGTEPWARSRSNGACACSPMPCADRGRQPLRDGSGTSDDRSPEDHQVAHPAPPLVRIGPGKLHRATVPALPRLYLLDRRVLSHVDHVFTVWAKWIVVKVQF